MGALNSIHAFLQRGVGVKTVAASTGGGANARLAGLVALAVGSDQSVTTYPAGSSGVNVVINDATYGTSGWTTLQSSGTISSHMLVAIRVTEPVLGQHEVQLASGAAGSEVTMASGHTGGGNAATRTTAISLFPPVQWPINERVAARVCGSSSGTITVAADFMTRPI